MAHEELRPRVGGVTGTVTTTINQIGRSREERVVLRLGPRRKKKVTWQEDTVDNENMGKKSSKKCCIFHKEKGFDEDSSDDEAKEKDPCDHGHDDDPEENAHRYHNGCSHADKKDRAEDASTSTGQRGQPDI
eukprot:jgi/Mesen1/4356/ME000022S03649